jgi:hypothetical protein
MLGGGRIKLTGGTLVLLLVVFAVQYFMRGGGGTTSSPSQQPSSSHNGSAAEEEAADFVTFVLNDTQRTWKRLLGDRYEDARLALFSGSVESGCGYAGSEMGPFYCPADRRAYLDLSFFAELKQRFGAPGDFAQAYVVAHEIGHHVQNLLGIDDKVRRMQQENPGQANAIQVKMELQADCFAGIWANSTDSRKLLESGDVEEALGAAAAIGDDRLQRQAGARVNPESWTHGSSEQRVAWFKRGMNNGSVDACDTFSAR